jgi:chemotaxis signal transduction protein
MEQPWPQPQEPVPDADDLPLAGLLAELLAASEGDSSASAALPPPAPAPGALDWQSEPVAAAEADQILRTLDQASSAETDPGSGSLGGMLLARLMEEPAAENMVDSIADAPVESVSGRVEANVAPETVEAEASRAGLPDQTAFLSPEAPPEAAENEADRILARLMGGEKADEEPAAAVVPPQDDATVEPYWRRRDEAVPDDAEMEAPVLASPEDVAANPGADADPLAAVAAETETGTADLSCPAASSTPHEDRGGTTAAPLAPEAVEPACPPLELLAPAEDTEAAESAEETVEFLAAGQPLGEEPSGTADPVAEAGSSAEGDSAAAPAEPAPAPPAAPVQPAEVSAGAAETRAAPAWPPVQRGLSAQQDEEDEFELVDASQAEKMVDQLLVAARSAIQSTQPPASIAGMKETSPARPAPGPAAQAPPAGTQALSAGPASAASGAKPAPAGDATERAAGAGEGASGAGRHAPDAVSEDHAAEVSPIPPAVTLMALGLPERLRARLESIGDVERILQSQTALRAAPEQKPRLLVFRAGGESYALPMESVREVECVSRVTPVPGAPGFVRGLVNLRGEILPLLDLAALVGRKEQRPAQRLIVAQAGPADPVVALMVEELNGLAPFSEAEVHPPSRPGPVRGSLEHRGREVSWLDPGAVFGSEALEKAAGQYPAFGPEAKA